MVVLLIMAEVMMKLSIPSVEYPFATNPFHCSWASNAYLAPVAPEAPDLGVLGEDQEARTRTRSARQSAGRALLNR